VLVASIARAIYIYIIYIYILIYIYIYSTLDDRGATILHMWVVSSSPRSFLALVGRSMRIIGGLSD